METINIIAKATSSLPHFIKSGNTALQHKLGSSTELHENIYNKTTEHDSKKMDIISNLLLTGCSMCPNNLYDTRKYGHNLPSNDVMTPFKPLPNIPTGIFRCTTGEVLGPGASKYGCYKNPEYFSLQHMTYFDIHALLSPCRLPAPEARRKPEKIQGSYEMISTWKEPKSEKVFLGDPHVSELVLRHLKQALQSGDGFTICYA